MTMDLKLGVLALALAAAIQPAAAQQFEVSVRIPESVPLHAASSDFSDSDLEARGGVLVINLSGTVSMANAGSDPVRALALRVEAGTRALGGRAAVVVPSLHARKGESVTVPVNLRLVRPLPLPPGPAVLIEPDAVLLASMTAAGPDRLGAARKLRVLEAEARRDRAFFLSRLESGGRAGLAAAMQASLRRQAERPRLGVRLARNGPALATPAAPLRHLAIAFLDIPGAPVVADSGVAIGRGRLWRAPRFELRNRSRQSVRHLQIAWLARDAAGVVYSLGSAPLDVASPLAPNAVADARGEQSFLVEIPGSRSEKPEPVAMNAYLRSATLQDGSVWVPGRDALEASGVVSALPVSAEEQRLSELYRDRGPAVVEQELRKLSGDFDQDSR